MTLQKHCRGVPSGAAAGGPSAVPNSSPPGIPASGPPPASDPAAGMATKALTGHGSRASQREGVQEHENEDPVEDNEPVRKLYSKENENPVDELFAPALKSAVSKERHQALAACVKNVAELNRQKVDHDNVRRKLRGRG